MIAGAVALVATTGWPWIAPATAQQVPTFQLITVTGRLQVIEKCDGSTVTHLISLPGVGVEIIGGASPLTVPVTITYDLSDGSTPPAPQAITVPGPEMHQVFQPNTGTATGSVTMTATAPDGWTIQGPDTVTAPIVLSRLAEVCATASTTTTATPTPPPPAPAAEPVSGSAGYTG